MKNRIQNKFDQLKAAGRKALVAFVTAGDPDLALTPQIVWGLEKAGVDVVELGVPFSDPMADGPVIQKSSERALRSGTNLRGILRSVAAIRRQSQIPLLLMGYFNPVFRYGVEKFFQDARRAGVDGVLLVDLPPEEAHEIRRHAERCGISIIFLLSPLSGPERIDWVARHGSGFVYYVSMTGITGASLKKADALPRKLRQISARLSLPLCVGFGIKTPEEARRIAAWADGVVVGSALVDCFDRQDSHQALAEMLRRAKALAQAVHG